MREIKFRAWAWDTQPPDYEKANYMLEVLGIDFDGGKVMLPYKIDKVREANLDDIELKEYIGLKDSKGVEIFEGDIVESSSSGRLTNAGKRPYLVIKHGSEFPDWHYPTGFIAESIDTVPDILDETKQVTCRDSINAAYSKDYTIIGDIHQNPELLSENSND